MFNKVYIIVDKESVKPLFIWKFSGSDIVIMVIGFLIGFYGTKAFSEDIYGLIIGSGIAVSIGLMLLEMPDHLSIIQHLIKWYNYRYRQQKVYYYFPKSEISRHDLMPSSSEEEEWINFEETIRRNGGYV